MKNSYLIIPLLLILFSCTSDVSKIHFYLLQLDLKLDHDFEIKKLNNEGLGDFLFSFEIHISPEDSELLIKQIESKPFFITDQKIISTSHHVNQSYQIAYYKDSYYYFHKYTPQDNGYEQQALFFYPKTRLLKYSFFED
jgi:hypothetical protein